MMSHLKQRINVMIYYASCNLALRRSHCLPRAEPEMTASSDPDRLLLPLPPYLPDGGACAHRQLSSLRSMFPVHRVSPQPVWAGLAGWAL
jgi:hypothetical protein